MNLPDHIHPISFEEALLNIGMSINEIRALTNTPEPNICQAKEVVFEVIGTMVYDTFPNPPEDIAEEVLSELLDNNILAPAPQIIRTVDELEALDRMTVLMHADDGHPLTLGWHWFDEEGNLWPESEEDLPAVVVATGAQVRAARTALQEATE